MEEASGITQPTLAEHLSPGIAGVDTTGIITEWI
jgi:hypothetical protein